MTGSDDVAKPFQTACPGCRTYFHGVPHVGNGTITELVATSTGETDTQARQCPICEGTGWVHGFQASV